MSTNTMSIYAEALSVNRDLKNGRINGESVGVANSRLWVASVKASLIPAYAVRKYRYDNMGNSVEVPSCDMSALYDAIRPIIKLIGEVNGDTLNEVNVAEEFVSQSIRFRVIDTSEAMAHAHSERRIAKNTLNDNPTEENQSAYDKWDIECKRLEAIPGNCKRIPAIQSETAFVKAIEIALGDAITKQTLRPVEDILAEKAAREAERKAKRKANKLAKKNAK